MTVLGEPLLRHGSSRFVVQLTALPDGRHLLSVGEDDVRLWDLEARAEVACWTVRSDAHRDCAGRPRRRTARLGGAGTPVRRLAVTPAGIRAIVGFPEPPAVLALEPGVPPRIVTALPAPAVSLSPDGALVVLGDPDPVLRHGRHRLFEVATLRELASWPADRFDATDRFSPTGEAIVTHHDCRASLRDLRGIERVGVELLSDGIDAGFGAEGRTLALSQGTPELTLIADGLVRRIGLPRAIGPFALFSAPPGEEMLAVDEQGFQLRDLEDGRLLRTLDGLWAQLPVFRNVMSIAVLGEGHPAGRPLRAVTAGEGPLLRVWDLASGREEKSGHRSELRSLALAPDGGRLLSLSEDGEARLWDASSGAPLASWRGAAGVSRIDWLDGGQLIGHHTGGCHEVFRAETGEILRTATGDPAPIDRRTLQLQARVRGTEKVLSPDGTRLVAVLPASPWRIQSIDTATGAVLGEAPLPDRAVALDAANHLAAVGLVDSTVLVFALR